MTRDLLTTNRESPLNETSFTTEDQTEAERLSASDLIQRASDLLGYPILRSEEDDLIEQGSRAIAEEALFLAESNLAAGVEALPPE